MYFKEQKAKLADDKSTIQMDFSENYSFQIQDETQDYHWSHSSCTIHPAVLYDQEKQEMKLKSLCFFV